MLSKPDDITRVKPHLFAKHFAVPRDRSVRTRVQHGGAASTVPLEIAVSRIDVSGKQEDVRLRAIFMIIFPTKYNVWLSK